MIYRDSAERIATSIGRPNPHTQLYVLDDDLRPVPVGVGGELYAAGFLLGRGYVNAPGTDRRPGSSRTRSARRRRADVPHRRPGAAGTPTATLEFVGRADNQVKIRGMRLELEEVEARSPSTPRCARPASWSGRTPRAATTSSATSMPLLTRVSPADAVKQWATEHMVEYMVPAHIVVHRRVPVDRQREARPPRAARAGRRDRPGHRRGQRRRARDLRDRRVGAAGRAGRRRRGLLRAGRRQHRGDLAAVGVAGRGRATSRPPRSSSTAPLAALAAVAVA